ncbi:transcription elongation factor GreA [Candidatus Roizmanbacteria bacterium]|nr:MAG: transcription elongation factor GreA [Candidatus Roizmanbacteria bacterium]
MTSTKIQFTKDGYKKLESELQELQTTQRPAAVDRLGRARAMGDLSENSEYTAAKEELAFVEGRIKEIEELMKRAEVVESQPSHGISIGAEVTVEREGREETYSIVGEFEADLMQKKLSATSPIGQALIGKKEGDMVDVEVPAGTIHYKILKIKK